MQFEQFNLDPRLMGAIRKAGYETPTPIQEAAIPAALRGRDLIGTAQTGTGKTAAFVLPILNKLLDGPRGMPRGPSSNLFKMGKTNAAVLPVPVWAVPITSRPLTAAGMAASCIGVGAS